MQIGFAKRLALKTTAFVALAGVFLLAVSLFQDARADKPEIVEVTAEVQANSLYAFSVTLKHPDTGWSHYADRWDIVTEDGTVLASRTLYHPHGNNEPFTRSLANVSVPIGTNTVIIQANCNVDGATIQGYSFVLPRR